MQNTDLTRLIRSLQNTHEDDSISLTIAKALGYYCDTGYDAIIILADTLSILTKVEAGK